MSLFTSFGHPIIESSSHFVILSIFNIMILTITRSSHYSIVTSSRRFLIVSLFSHRHLFMPSSHGPVPLCRFYPGRRLAVRRCPDPVISRFRSLLIPSDHSVPMLSSSDLIISSSVLLNPASAHSHFTITSSAHTASSQFVNSSSRHSMLPQNRHLRCTLSARYLNS